ncbi:MAG: tadA 1 [Humibacillus sp.]|nr:tadA 1 [Humibacillus sp.]
MGALDPTTARSWLATAVAEARAGLAEGGIPIGGALYSATGTLLGSGHNRRVQDDDPSVHGETDAFRRAGRQSTYAGTTMVTTLSPCWYCSGLVRQFGISRLVVGEATTFFGGHEWLADNGVEVLVLDDAECTQMMTDFIAARPDLWNEDIGVPGSDDGEAS